MTVKVQGVEKRIGLALSGGGFRAAAFHLGVFEALHKRGLLWNLDLLSGVSGGSIAAAFLALKWKSNTAFSELENYLLTRSIAVGSVIGGLLDPFHTRLDKLAQTYERDLYGTATLEHLKAGPRLYLNSTNLATGNLFSFVTGGNGLSEMGEHELGFTICPDFLLARAVAASSAFPPVFPPLVIAPEVFPSALNVSYVSLTDGGVYDNLGVGPGLRDRNALNYLIASDAGKPFEIDTQPTTDGAIVLVKALDVLMEQARGLQFDRLLHRSLAAQGPRPIWFSIDSVEGQTQEGDAAFASSIRTNLTALSAVEIKTLKRHGASLVEARLAKYAPELLAD